jgi:uncharacterized protein (TIGR03067 family)
VPPFTLPTAPEAGPAYITFPGMPGELLAATHFVGISGVGLDAAEYGNDNPKRGIFGWDRVTRKDDVKDGLDKTIALLLVRGEHKAPWLAGGGATVRSISDNDEDGKPIAPFVCTTYPGKPDAPSKFDGKRGTIAIMADGKVRFIPEDIPAATLRALCTIAGGEKIDKIDEICPVIENPDARDLKTDEASGAPPIGVPDKTKGSDQERIQGNWVPTTAIHAGVALPPVALKTFRLSISGNTAVATGGGPEQRSTFTLDSSKTPKHYDSVDLTGPHKGKKQLGIYELTDKQLKICMGIEGGTTRPTDFTSTAANKQNLIVLERATGAAPAAKPAAWKDYTPASKAFTVKMPGEVGEAKQEVPVPTGGKISVTVAMSSAAGSSYTVTQAVHPPGFIAKLGADGFLQQSKALLTTTTRGKITSETNVKLGAHSGREWVIEVPDAGTVKVRVYLVGDTAFQLAAQPFKEAEAKTFFDSFKLGS